MRPRVELLIADVDNTLYDWVEIWHSSFSAMLDELVRISGVPLAELKREIRTIHQRVGTSEYAFVIQEIPSLGLTGSTKMDETPYASAVNAFRDARKASMKLYPGVLTTLERIVAAGVRVVCYTESLAFYTAMRFRWLGLDGVVTALFSPDDHSRPDGLDIDSLRSRPASEYGLVSTQHRLTPAGHFKPDRTVLDAILQEFRVSEVAAAYVGDSLSKDIAMARDVGVLDIHAAYGVAQNKAEYSLLREVSHWSDAEVARERQIIERPVTAATVTLNSFPDILGHLGLDREGDARGR